ncbi:MAG TPA: 1,2-phenylacetyl-CoA epoxidase subunit PaaC [Gaiellaceae bacterium]
MNPGVDLLLSLADDELILGWRDSEWTGIAPFLEEDVAFSSIAQTEVGHARAWYELVAKELDTDADSLAFDREPDEYRSAPLVELALAHDWARTIARHWLYESADAIRIGALKESDDPDIAGLAEKIEREEAYHRMHAEMWAERLREEPAFQAAVEELWPYAAALLPPDQRSTLAEVVGQDVPSNSLLLAHERGRHCEDLGPLWEEMTMVRRSAPGATW